MYLKIVQTQVCVVNVFHCLRDSEKLFTPILSEFC